MAVLCRLAVITLTTHTVRSIIDGIIYQVFTHGQLDDFGVFIPHSLLHWCLLGMSATLDQLVQHFQFVSSHFHAEARPR